jgi:RNA polymerase sigma-70 factor (ECF subfamily)
MRAFRRHRPQAFEELLAEHLDGLFRTAVRLCGGHEADAEDLLQDATLRAFEGHGHLRNEESGRSWLFTILVRTHYNRARARGRRPETAFTDLDEVALQRALAEWQPLRTPAEELERRLVRAGLDRAMDALAPELRSTVWLVDVEGFTQREAAAMTEVPEGTIASRLFRARRQLRELLADAGYGSHTAKAQASRRRVP